MPVVIVKISTHAPNVPEVVKIENTTFPVNK
jgi:hypothetical protein